jgi:voltage-gated potassium channel
MQKMINKLKDHYIICGYGRIGRVVAQEILGEGLPVVVVESDPGLIAQLEREGVPCILGDATEDQVLCNAGLIRAKALIACLNQVAENVYITLTARQMNPEILIVARADREDSIQKLTRAGASRAITPHMIGGRRMAQIILRPTVTDFLELAIEGRTLQMEEIRVSPGSELAGKNLVDSEIRARFNVIVIAIEKHSGQTIFNPSAKEVIHAGDNLVMVGMKENFSKLQKIMDPESA